MSSIIPSHQTQELTTFTDSSDNEVTGMGESRGSVVSTRENFKGSKSTNNSNENAASSSEDGVIPVRSNRRVRKAPILLSSEDESDLGEAMGPVTPVRKLRDRNRPEARTTITSGAGGGDVSSQVSSPPNSTSPATLINGDLSDDCVQPSNKVSSIPTQNQELLAVSSDSVESTSEDEVVTPACRRRSNVHIEHIHTKTVDSGRDSTDNLEDEVADLDGNGKQDSSD